MEKREKLNAVQTPLSSREHTGVLSALVQSPIQNTAADKYCEGDQLHSIHPQSAVNDRVTSSESQYCKDPLRVPYYMMSTISPGCPPAFTWRDDTRQMTWKSGRHIKNTNILVYTRIVANGFQKAVQKGVQTNLNKKNIIATEI